MSAENPRFYKWYPTEETDLGTMPFEGDFTANDRIEQKDSTGISTIYFYNATAKAFGRNVKKKVGPRIQTVWEPGVKVGPVTCEGTPMPVWFCYYGDGVCAVKVPNGEVEEVTP